MQIISTPKYFIGFLAVAVLLVQCGSPQPKEETSKDKVFDETVFSGEAQGTTYTIRYIGDTTSYQTSVDSLLERFDKDLSNWREGSLINQINAHDRTDTVFAFYDSTKYFSVLFDVSREIWQKTEGAFDPTVYPLVELWGFGLTNRQEVNETMVEEVRSKVGMEPANVDMIEMNRDEYIYDVTHIRKGQEGVRMDFNAIAQGFSVDLIGELLEERGIENYMVELGGEVYCKGVNSKGTDWRIAVDKPKTEGEREFQAVLNVNNSGVATSGSYRKFYEEDGVRYSHAIDPRTGYPVQHSLLSVTVMTSSCAFADAYATAFLVMGKEASQQFLEENADMGLEVYLIWDEDGEFKTWSTPGMAEKIEELTNS